MFLNIYPHLHIVTCTQIQMSMSTHVLLYGQYAHFHTHEIVYHIFSNKMSDFYFLIFAGPICEKEGSVYLSYLCNCNLELLPILNFILE